jgi:hypothetical protein
MGIYHLVSIHIYIYIILYSNIVEILIINYIKVRARNHTIAYDRIFDVEVQNKKHDSQWDPGSHVLFF